MGWQHIAKPSSFFEMEQTAHIERYLKELKRCKPPFHSVYLQLSFPKVELVKTTQLQCFIAIFCLLDYLFHFLQREESNKSKHKT